MFSNVLIEALPKIILVLICVAALQLAIAALTKKRRKASSPQFIAKTLLNAHNKTKGDRFELEIGAILSSQGWEITYVGLEKGKKDGGLDLICRRGDITSLIQCKCWNPNAFIYENEINQFCGAIEKYKREHPGEKTVQGSFITTARLDDEARRVAKMHEIEVIENFDSDCWQMPPIKNS